MNKFINNYENNISKFTLNLLKDTGVTTTSKAISTITYNVFKHDAMASVNKETLLKDTAAMIYSDISKHITFTTYDKKENALFNRCFTGQAGGVLQIDYKTLVMQGFEKAKKEVINELQELYGEIPTGAKIPQPESFLKPLRHLVKCLCFNSLKVTEIDKASLSCHKSKDKEFKLDSIQTRTTATKKQPTQKKKVFVSETLVELVNAAYSDYANDLFNKLQNEDDQTKLCQMQLVIEKLSDMLNIKLNDHLDLQAAEREDNIAF